MGAEAKQRFAVHAGWGGALVHTWRWGEPNHGPAEIPTNGEEWGMGAVPGVTHLKTLKKAFHSSDTSVPNLIIKKNNNLM